MAEAATRPFWGRLGVAETTNPSGGGPDDRHNSEYPTEAVVARTGARAPERLEGLPHHGLSPRHLLRGAPRVPGRRRRGPGRAAAGPARAAPQPGGPRGRSPDSRPRAGLADPRAPASRHRAAAAGRGGERLGGAGGVAGPRPGDP